MKMFTDKTERSSFLEREELLNCLNAEEH